VNAVLINDVWIDGETGNPLNFSTTHDVNFNFAKCRNGSYLVWTIDDNSTDDNPRVDTVKCQNKEKEASLICRRPFVPGFFLLSFLEKYRI
jgi:hypothetical protein